MDRLSVVMTLEALDPTDFASIVASIPDAFRHVSRHGTIPEKAAELLGWTESPPGPGLDAIRRRLTPWYRLIIEKRLRELNPTDFALIVADIEASIPDESRVVSGLDQVRRQGTIPEKAAELVRWAESPTGLGLDAIWTALELLRNRQCPYRGLEFFDEAHSRFFFGREALTKRLLDALRPAPGPGRENRFLAIIGPSGCGKSSLARAGLVHALRQGGIDDSRQWRIVKLRPGYHPAAGLVHALSDLEGGVSVIQDTCILQHIKIEEFGNDKKSLHLFTRRCLRDAAPTCRLVLLVDQFEEVFTLCQDDAERKVLIDNLLYAATDPDGQTIIVLTLRADFYGSSASYPDPALRTALAGHQELVGPMTEDELRQAIERPVQVDNFEFGLVDMLLHDVRQQPGALPLLQFALKELWLRCAGRQMTGAAYKAMGGLKGTLENRANEVFNSFTEPEQDLCRRIFLRLINPGEGTEDTGRRVPRAALTAIGDGTLMVLQRLVEARLIIADRSQEEDYVEVAHVALISGWTKLRQWINTDRASLLTHHRLTDAAREWENNGSDPGFLYRGARLAVAREWAAANPRVLDPLEDMFLAASVKEKRRPALHFTLLMGIAVVILLLVTVAAFQFAQSLAKELADSHLRDLVYVAQGVASTVLWELERLSGPVLEAANNKDLRDLLKDNKGKCPPNPEVCRLIDAMIKNNDVQPWLKSHREEIDRLEKLLKEKLKDDNKPRAQGPLKGNAVKQNGVQCWLQNYAEKIASKSGKYLSFESYYVVDGVGTLVACWQRDYYVKDKNGEPQPYWHQDPEIIGKNFPFRDYFLGAMRHRHEVGRGSVHISQVYQAVNDGFHKFAISAPVHESESPDSPLLGVVVVTIATHPKLSSFLPKNEKVTVVLAGRNDIDPLNDHDTAPQQAGYRILFHPAYRDRQAAVMIDNPKCLENVIKPPFGQPKIKPPDPPPGQPEIEPPDPPPGQPEIEPPDPPPGQPEIEPPDPPPGQPEIEPPDPQGFPPEKAMDDYCDPLGEQPGKQYEQFRGRMLAGFAPVGNTEFAVIVQQRYDQAIKPGHTLARNLVLWGGIALSLSTIITGAAVWYGLKKLIPRPTTETKGPRPAANLLHAIKYRERKRGRS